MRGFYFQKMAHTDHKIRRYSTITNNRAVVDNNLIFEADGSVDYASFIVSLYKKVNLGFPKFYKMDAISKLGVMGTELLLQGLDDLPGINKENVAVVIANSQSSLETDSRFQETIADKSKYFPNPATFVYTLPNLMIGEICIKNKFKGESAFFIFEQPDFTFLHDYVSNLFDVTGTELAITGWVNLDRERNYEAILYLIENGNISSPETSSLAFCPEVLSTLYKETRK
jgi:hypothetical protein